MKFGKVALVLADDCPAIFSCKSTLLRNSKINPFFLVTYLSCKYGYRLIRRGKRGAAQPGINLFDLNIVPSPIFSNSFQGKIELIVNDYCQSLKEQSKRLYKQAEDLLLSELNLKDWQPTKETIAIKRFAESYLVSDRFDAEYYQPKYEQAEKAVQNCDFTPQKLGSLIEAIQNGFDFREFTEEGTAYIRVGDIKQGQINIEGAAKVPITIADVDKPVGLEIGDILFTRKGSFGKSAVVTKLEVEGIISSEIMLLRLTSIARLMILPEYVSLFLNSKFGYLQVERRVHGVAYYSISQADMANISIPILPMLEQEKIIHKMKSSFSLKLKSKQLLEIAKTGVERAIETDEATATAWMNQQLEALGVELSG
jgi:type I restriction enzyme M protein